MSAPTSHDPLVVNTKDGVTWLRRAVTSEGRGLYAVTDSCKCPPYLMATLAELAEHGIAGSADALPMPVGPEPQPLRPIAYAAKNTDLLLADAAERSRAAEWPWDMWCRICHIRPTSHRTEAEALEAADRHVKLCHAPQAEVHRLVTAGGLAELERLQARVAELEALTPAAIQTCRVCGAGYSYGQSCSTCLFKVQMAAEVAARAERPVNRLTETFMPVGSLREDDEFHLHHTYRVPRDLPEPACVQTSGACKACGSAPDSWCPDCGACQRGCYDGFVDNSCVHAGASWVGVE